MAADAMRFLEFCERTVVKSNPFWIVRRLRPLPRTLFVAPSVSCLLHEQQWWQ